MTAMVSLSRLSNTPNVNVNVKPNVNVGTHPSYETAETLHETPLESSLHEGSVCYPPPIYSESEYIKLKNENEVLKLIIDM